MESANRHVLTLVVLAAGMGSRYGGLKQLDAVGPSGEVLLDYSVTDAVAAGFSEVVFVIRREIEDQFRNTIGKRYESAFPELRVQYVFQELSDLPGSAVLAPVSTKATQQFAAAVELRKQSGKPWGTAHALLTARHLVKGPFAVINADDYYGSSGYRLLANFLHHCSQGEYAMVGYQLKNTLSQHGTVSRGICESTQDGFLTTITEQTALRASGEGIVAEGDSGHPLLFSGEELVSLNFWAFTPDLFPRLEQALEAFLRSPDYLSHPSTAEFYLPSAVSDFIQKGEVSVQLLATEDPWFGLTHPADLAHVKEALREYGVTGKYPSPLF